MKEKEEREERGDNGEIQGTEGIAIRERSEKEGKRDRGMTMRDIRTKIRKEVRSKKN
jgi:hypothetical protein